MLRNTPNESTARTGIRRYFSTINNVTGRNSKSAQRIRELLQRSQLQEKENEERYGDEYGPKPPQTLRCMSKNICNAPAEPYKEKSRKIVKSIKLSESDVIGIQEPGLNVRHLDESETWAARTYRVLNKARTLIGYNRHFDTNTKYQRGGTLIMTANEAAPRVSVTKNEDPTDPSGLGRWVSVALDRKGHTKLRILSVYCPCYSTGFFSTYQQQARWLKRQGRKENPRKALEIDLKLTLWNWIDDGDDIVLMMDANEDVRAGPLSNMLRQLGMRDLILDRHGHKEPPATHYENDNKVPIDAIFSTLQGDIKGGYLAVDEGPPGDHRTLWVDIPFQIAFGHNAPNLHKREIENLNPSDPRLRKRYNRKVIEGLKKEKLLDLAKELREKTDNNWPVEELKRIHEKLDRGTYKVRKEAARSLRKKRMGRIPWSPAYRKAKATKKLWAKLENKLKFNKKMNTKYMRRLMKRAGNEDALTIDLQEVTKRKITAFQHYNKLRKQAAQLRRDHLDDLADAIAKEKNEKKSQVLKNLKAREAQKRRAERTRAYKSKQKGSQVTTMRYMIDGEMQDLHTQDEMEHWSIIENSTRFTRCLDSEFTTEPLITLLGKRAETQAAQDILDGRREPPEGISWHAKELLLQARRPPPEKCLPPEDLKITAEKAAKFWKKKDPKTASEPTTLSIQHQVVGAYNPIVAEVISVLQSAPFEKGFSPPTWEKGTDYQIFKKEGNTNLAEMRTILLFDALFNGNNMFLGRLAMEQAEKTGNLGRFQFGSRKKYKSIMAALVILLLMENAIAMHMILILCGQDKSQCYDRINHNFASLATQTQGIPKEPVQSMYQILQNLVHYIMTGFGVSTIGYGGTERAERNLLPIAGVGQGNAAGPATYAMVASMTDKVMEKHGAGALITSPISMKQLRIPSVKFVDDNTQAISGESKQSKKEDVMPKAQKEIDMMEGCGSSTGEAINIDKTKYWLLHPKWNGDSWQLLSPAKSPGDLTIVDKSKERMSMKRLQMHETYKFLGVEMGPRNKWKTETELIEDKSKGFANRVSKRGNRIKNDAWYALNHMMWATVNYPTPVTSMTWKQWNKGIRPALRVCLPRAGIARNFPRIVLHGPIKYQGGGLMHPWFRQQVEKIAVLWESAAYPTTLPAEVVKANFEILRTELGIGGSITTPGFEKLAKCVTQGWTSNLWLGAYRFGIRIKDTFEDLILHRQHDDYLMRVFLNQGYHPLRLRTLNYCRMYLQVITIADITTACGAYIRRAVMEGKKDVTSLQKLDWPNQPKSLKPAMWAEWKNALNECLLIPYSSTRKLVRPLGTWCHDTDEWPWRKDNAVNTLYHKEGPLFTRYIPINNRRQCETYERASEAVPLPTNTTLVSVAKGTDNKLVTLEGRPSPSKDASPRLNMQPMTMGEAREQLSDANAWTINWWQCPNNGREVAEGIIKGTAVACGDGSHVPGEGTASFVLMEKLRAIDETKDILALNTTPGSFKDHKSYRSELTGIAGIFMILEMLVQVHDIQSGQVRIGCDGKEALRAIFEDWEPMPHSNDFDIIYDIRKRKEKLPIVVTGHWVKGHQDEQRNIRKHLDDWAKANIEMDTRAKAHLRTQTPASIPNLQFGNEPISFWLNDTKLARFDIHYLYDEIVGAKLAKYWSEKHDIPENLLNAINWEQQGKALKNWHSGSHRWLIKFATGFLGVGKMMERRGEQDHSKCPRCDEDEEDNKHVIRCQDPDAKLKWNAEFDRLLIWMSKQRTDPALQAAILAKIQAWQRNFPSYHYRGPRELEEAIKEQDKIGWWNFMLGRVSKKITEVQNRYYQRINSKHTGDIWTRRLIREVWTMSWNMWEHRNRRLHGGDTAENNRTILQLHREIKDEIAKGKAGLQKEDRHLITAQTKDWILAEPIPIMKEWLEAVQTSRRLETQEQAKQLRQLQMQREFMRNWISGRSNEHFNTTPSATQQNEIEDEIMIDDDREEVDTGLDEGLEDWFEDFEPDWQTRNDEEDDEPFGPLTTQPTSEKTGTETAENQEEQLWEFEGVIDHMFEDGEYKVLVKWLPTTQAWIPTWESLARFTEDIDAAEACKEYAEENDLLEKWSEFIPSD